MMDHSDFILLARKPSYPWAFWRAMLTLAALLAAGLWLSRGAGGVSFFKALAGLAFMAGLLFAAHTAMRHVTYARIVADQVHEPADQNGRKWTTTRDGLSASVLKPFRTNWLPSKKWKSGADLFAWTLLCECGLAVLATSQPSWSWKVWLPALVSALFAWAGYAFALAQASAYSRPGAGSADSSVLMPSTREDVQEQDVPNGILETTPSWLYEREAWVVVKGFVVAAIVVTAVVVLHP